MLISIRSFFINRNFMLLWCAQALSSFGEFVLASTVVVWLITDLARDSVLLPVLIAAVVATTTVPRLILAPFAGVLVDRWHAKRTMIGTDVVRAAMFLPLIGIVILATETAAVISAVLVVLIAVACASQFFNPARAAIMQTVIPPDRRVDASSKAMFAVLGVSVIATMLGPGLFTLVGPLPSLFITLATFLTSATLVAFTRNIQTVTSTGADRQSYWADLASGMRLAWKTPSVRLVLIGIGLYGISLGVNSSVLSLFALKTLSLSPSQYGLVSASFAFGGLVGSLFATKVLRRVGSERAFVGAITVMGISYAGYSVTAGFFTAAGVMLIAGIAFAFYAVAQGPILQDATPAGYMGRVSSVSTPVLASSSLVATAACSLALSVLSATGAAPGTILAYQAYGVAIFIASCFLAIGGVTMAVAHRRGAS